MPKTKTSYGIALCRNNPNKNNCVEIILVKKRYSYQYYNFVCGHYNIKNSKDLRLLFDNMSFSEKIDILGMKFSKMWYRIWLDDPEAVFNVRDHYNKNKIINCQMAESDIYKLYIQKRNKFYQNFPGHAGQTRIKNLVVGSSNSDIYWELPKGRKHAAETNIDCAMREFCEETSIPSTKYKILFDIEPVIECHYDSDVVYKNIYYLAKMREGVSLEPRINFANFEQITEIEQIRWVSMEEIQFMNLNKYIYGRLINLYKSIAKKFKQRLRPILKKI